MMSFIQIQTLCFKMKKMARSRDNDEQRDNKDSTFLNKKP